MKLLKSRQPATEAGHRGYMILLTGIPPNGGITQIYLWVQQFDCIVNSLRCSAVLI